MLKVCVRTSEETELRTQAAAVMKSPTSKVKPGRPRKKKRDEQERMMVFNTSWWHTRTHTHTNMLIGNKQQFPHWYHYPSITALTWYRNKQLFSIRTKTEYLSQYVHSQMGFLDLEWARGLISVDGGKQKYFVNGPPHERHGRVKAFSSNR